MEIPAEKLDEIAATMRHQQWQIAQLQQQLKAQANITAFLLSTAHDGVYLIEPAAYEAWERSHENCGLLLVPQPAGLEVKVTKTAEETQQIISLLTGRTDGSPS